MSIELCTFYEGYLYMTSLENEETILYRMRLDGSYYEPLNRFQGTVPAMVIENGKIYYLFNAAGEDQSGYVGCMGINGAENRALVHMNNKDLEYCYMTGIVDNNNIYYTCSSGGSEMLNNLYCYSILDGNNRQISSECGRYVATSDEIDCIIFASSDGSEIRRMNKDGSNPRVMREENGSAWPWLSAWFLP